MARVIDWPRGLARIGYTRLSGPRSVGAASSESVSGFIQTTSSPFGVWRYQLSLPPMRKALHRKYRSMVTALNGGANAVRVPFADPDRLTLKESGISVGEYVTAFDVTWSNGMPWSNGCNNAGSRPLVGVAESAAKDATIIRLKDEFWGYGLDGGWIGFTPLHFGKYEITEVISDGQYRIWPPLRAALTANESYASLSPTVAMRLESESAGTVQRSRDVADGNTLTMIEVEDADVRDYFAD